MTDGRCEKHDNWHAECRRCLEEAAYARGAADERALLVAELEALHAESLTLPLSQDYIDGIECAVDHLKEET